MDRFTWTLTTPLTFQQILRQAQSSLHASPYRAPSMNLHVNPQVSNSEVSLDEQFCSKLWGVYRDVQNFGKNIP